MPALTTLSLKSQDMVATTVASIIALSSSILKKNRKIKMSVVKINKKRGTGIDICEQSER